MRAGMRVLIVSCSWASIPRPRYPQTAGETLPLAQPSTPVAPWGAPTGFDSGEPRWRR